MGQVLPAMINYTVDDGLPSSETYDILQDSKGYIWIATDRGVSRYNGYEFENFTTEDGLTDNVVFRLQEDYKGRVWFQTMNFKFFYYENNQFITYKFNDKIFEGIDKINAFPLRMNNFIVDSLEHLHISFAVKGGFFISNTGQINYYDLPFPEENLSQVRLKSINDQLFIVPNHRLDDNLLYIQPTKDSNVISVNKHKVKTPIDFASDKVYTHQKFYNDYNIVSTPQQIVKLASNQKYKTLYKTKVPSINAIERIDSSVWVGGYDFGILILKNDSLQYQLLNGTSVSSFFESKDGIWITSLNHGVFFMPATKIQTVNLFEGNDDEKWVIDLQKKTNQLLIGNANGVIYKLNHKLSILKTYQLYDAKNRKGDYSYSFTYDTTTHKAWVSSSKNSLLLLNNDSLLNVINATIIDPRRRSSAYNSIVFNDTVVTSFNEGVLFLKREENRKTKLIQKIKVLQKENRHLTLYKDCNNQIWGGGVYGLSKVILKNDSIDYKYLGNSIPNLGFRITCIAEKDSILWLGTRGNGIILFNKKSSTFLINSKIGFKPKNINDILVDNDNIWVASNSGVTLIKEINSGQYAFQQINTASGLSTNEVTCLEMMGDSLLVGTKKGLNIINTKTFQLNDNKNPPIFTAINVGGDPATNTNNIEITYDKNSIDFSYLTFAYGTGGDITYQYKIAELDDEWFTTKDRTARFVALPPGDYTFKVRTLKNDSHWTKASTLHFSVLPAIWQTWYFWVTIGVVFVIVVSSIAYSSIKNANERSEMNARIENLKQSSLSSQMNPHFVFNVLNSILTFLLTNSQRNAAKYLSSFAWLMRKTFNLSRESKVSLEEEIDVLTAYFKLEKLRIAEKVEFQLEIDSDLDVEILKVPPLILQPFVENAILHGISQDKKSIISVNLTKEDSYMKVVIEDNGIGIEKSRKEKEKHTHSKSHKSSGLDISKERVALLHKIKNEKAQVKIMDLSYLKNTNKTGTRVIFYLPLIDED